MTESERPAPTNGDEGGDDPAQAGGATPRRRRDSRRRRLARGTLLVVGCLLAIFSVLIMWVRAELLNTDAYVATMAPLASSPAVQNAIATDISNQLSAKVDVQAKVRDALPPSAASLAAPLATQLKSFTYDAAKRLVSS